jgi:EpsI family protein
VSAIIPIMANWLRVTIVVLAGELTAMQHPLVHSHITFGWILFGSLILPACWFGARFSDIGRRDVQTKAATEDEPGIERRFGIVTAATIAAMTVGPSYAQWIYHTATGPTSARPLTLPDGLGEWVTVTSVGTSWKPAFDGVSREAQATYERGGKYIHLYVADYDNPQSQGHELVAQMNSIANKSRWRIVDSSRRKWDGVSGVKMTVGESEIASGIGDRLLVWYWYRIAGRFTSDPYVAKLLEAWALIAGWKVSSLIAVATTAREDDLESSRSLLADFVQDFSYLSHGEATALR